MLAIHSAILRVSLPFKINLFTLGDTCVAHPPKTKKGCLRGGVSSPRLSASVVEQYFSLSLSLYFFGFVRIYFVCIRHFLDHFVFVCVSLIIIIIPSPFSQQTFV